MVKTPLRFRRQTLSGSMIPARRFSREEEEFSKVFADALNHATAVIAADPEMRFPPGSIAERIGRFYLRVRADLRPAIQSRARGLLSAPLEERRALFGAYADRGPEAWRLARRGLDLEMKELLRQAVRARLDSQYKDIEKLFNVSVNAAAKSLGAARPKHG